MCCVCVLFLLHLLLRRSFICCFFICSLFFCYVVCWRWQFHRVVEFLGKSYFHVKINPFKQLWCFNRIAFGNLLHVSSWRVYSIYFVREAWIRIQSVSKSNRLFEIHSDQTQQQNKMKAKKTSMKRWFFCHIHRENEKTNIECCTSNFAKLF